jgi:hypothetical protein
MGRIRRVVTLLAATCVVAVGPSARAQGDDPCTSGSAAGACLRGQTPAGRGFGLSPTELATFASIVNDSQATVAQRLEGDPALEAVALDAVRAYDDRHTTGKQRAIAGFAVIAAGDLASAIILVTTPGYPRIAEKDRGREPLAIVVGLLSFAIGAGVAIPGIKLMARPSDAEYLARHTYNDAIAAPGRADPPPSARDEGVPPPVALMLPLVAVEL